MKTAKITIDETAKTARVHNFLGFTEDWNEIVLPHDREAVKSLREAGYSIEFDSDDI